MDTISVGEPTLASAAWRFRFPVLVAVLVLVGAATAYADTNGDVYTATATMVLQDPHSDPVFGGPTSQPPDRYTGDQISVLRSPQLAAAAAAVGAGRRPPLGLSADYFSSHTVVTGTPSSGNLVQIMFASRDASSALAGVSAIKTAYEKTVSDAVRAELSSLLAQIDSELNSINTQLGSTPAPDQAALIARRDTLNAKRDQVAVDAASGSNGVAIYLPPETATHNSKLAAALPVLIVAAVIGLVLGVSAAYVLATRRRIFRGSSEPATLLDAPLVAEIPKIARTHPLPAADGAPEVAASAFRTAALFIQARQTTADGRETPRPRTLAAARRLAVVSAKRREGRTTVAANVGIALAGSGLRTLLIDADAGSGTGGLLQLLYGGFGLEPAIDRVRVGLGASGMSLANIIRPSDPFVRLSVLLVGRPRHLDEGDRESRLQELESAFNVVIIDAPPLSDIGPYWPLVRRADALVVVTDRTLVAQVEEVSRLLGATEMPAFGYVYNHVPQGLRQAWTGEKMASPALPSPPAPNLSGSA